MPNSTYISKNLAALRAANSEENTKIKTFHASEFLESQSRVADGPFVSVQLDRGDEALGGHLDEKQLLTGHIFKPQSSHFFVQKFHFHSKS